MEKILLNCISQDGLNGGVDCIGALGEVSVVILTMITTI